MRNIEKTYAVRAIHSEDFVELSAQLELPLTSDAGWRKNKHATHDAARSQLTDNQARLNRLSKPHLVCQEEAMRVCRADPVEDRDLVRFYLDSRVREG